jgi:hypothetical protein
MSLEGQQLGRYRLSGFWAVVEWAKSTWPQTPASIDKSLLR